MITIGVMYQPHEEALLPRLQRLVSSDHLHLMPIGRGSNQAINRRNLILSSPDTEYFTWVDPDDFIELGYIREAIQLMDDHPQVAMVKGIEITHREDGRTEWSDQKPVSGLELSNNPEAYHNGVVFRRDKLLAVVNQLPAERFYSLDHAYRVVLAHQYDYRKVDAVGYHWVHHPGQHHRKPLSEIGDLIAPIDSYDWIKHHKPDLLREVREIIRPAGVERQAAS